MIGDVTNTILRLGLQIVPDPAATARIAAQVGNQFNDEIKEATENALKAGFSPAAAARFTSALLSGVDQMAKLKAQQNWNELKLQDQSLTADHKKRLKLQIIEDGKKLKALDARIRREQIQTNRIIDEMKRRQDQTQDERLDDLSQGLSAVIQGVTSKDLGSLVTGFGNALKKAGKEASIFAAGSGDTKIGAFLAKAGPLLVTIGAVAAGLSAVVALFVEADAAAKQLNTDILASGVSVDEFGSKFGSVRDNLFGLADEMVSAASVFGGSLSDWGVTAKDIAEVLGAYAQAGITFAEMGRGAKTFGEATEKAKKNVETTLTYAKLFNTSTAEMATSMGQWMEGLGETVDSLAGSLSAVRKAAAESGFGMKRFFSMISSATADMSMYNVRLAETGALLLRIGRVLGPKAGQQLVQDLTKGLEGGVLDISKKLLLMGPKGGDQVGHGRDIARLAATLTAEEIQRILNTKERDQVSGFEKAFREFGLSVSMLTGMPDKLVDAFAEMDPEKRDRLLARLAEIKGEEGLLGQFRNLFGQAAGTRAGAGLTEQAAALRGTTGVPQLMFEMRLLMGAVDEMTRKGLNVGDLLAPKSQQAAIITEALEKGGVTDAERQKALIAIFSDLRGTLLNLEDAAVKGQSMNAEALAEMNKRLFDQHGVMVENGQVFRAVMEQGKLTKKEQIPKGDYLALFRAQNKKFEEFAKTPVPEDLKAAKQTAAATTDMARRLETGVASILQNIDRNVRLIKDRLYLGSAGKDEVKAELDADIATQRIRVSGMAAEVEDRKKALLEAQDAESKELANQALAASEERLRRAKEEEQRLRQRAETLSLGHLAKRDFDKFTAPQVRAWLDETAGNSEELQGLNTAKRQEQKEMMWKTQSSQGAKDFLVQFGTNGEIKYADRIDPNDVIVGSKGGGALSQAASVGGGRRAGDGGATNVFHLYNDANGTLQAIRKAQKAGVLS